MPDFVDESFQQVVRRQPDRRLNRRSLREDEKTVSGNDRGQSVVLVGPRVEVDGEVLADLNAQSFFRKSNGARRFLRKKLDRILEAFAEHQSDSVATS